MILHFFGLYDLGYVTVNGMSKHHKLASAILDGGFYEFRRQLTYKCEWCGSTLVVADRFYPSSKTCSQCKSVKQDLTLKDRMFKCDGAMHADFIQEETLMQP